MTRFASFLTAIALLVGFAPLALATAPAHDGVCRVEDKAGAFTPEGVKKVEATFHGVSFKSVTHYTVVTVGEKDITSGMRADYDAAKKDKSKAAKFFRDWAHDLAKAERERGVFSLIFLNGDQFFVDTVADRQTDVYRSFTDADAKKVTDAIIDGFRMAKGKNADDARSIRDTALIAAANVVISELKNTAAPADTTTSRVSTTENTEVKWYQGIGGLICMAIVGILVVWLIVGVIRALTMGGGGYGGYGGGYGYGGGGGGFMSGFLGGMFGAAAGMYLYDTFSGHHSSGSYDSGSTTGGSDYNADTGAGDFDGGAEAGGGDFGDAGGGDFGGGDIGGGGDFGGGGGDFGGGGGDFGGGDW